MADKNMPPWGMNPFQAGNPFASMCPPGFNLDNEPIDDPAELENKIKEAYDKLNSMQKPPPKPPKPDPEPEKPLKEKHPPVDYYKPNPQEIKNLNQYMGYFTTAEGDFPVSVVADSMKEAAKILSMPGVFGESVTEPSIIKFIKGKIAVSIPVRMTGFTVNIDPINAADSGAHATPVHAEVKNGTEVLFTAHEPFGWKFVGWYKGEQLLSRHPISWIEVYDPYSSLIHYTAKYEFDPVLRNGRYLELGHGWYFDFKFDGWATHEGKMVLYTNVVPDWHFVLIDIEMSENKYTFISDPSVVQEPNDLGMTAQILPTPIGFNFTVTNIHMENPFGIIPNQQFALKWVGNQFNSYPKGYTRKDLEEQG